jgi:hypothetical protein
MIGHVVVCDVCAAKPAWSPVSTEQEARRLAGLAGFIRKRVDGRWVDLCQSHRLVGSRRPATRLRDR